MTPKLPLMEALQSRHKNVICMYQTIALVLSNIKFIKMRVGCSVEKQGPCVLQGNGLVQSQGKSLFIM